MKTVLCIAFAFAIVGALGSPQNRCIPGGKCKADTTDPELQEKLLDYSWKGAVKVNAASNSFHHFIPVRVAKVETQVVAGIKYHLQIIYGQSSDCTNNQYQPDEVTRDKNCTLKTDGLFQKCYITVWSQPWNNIEEVKNKGCLSVDKDSIGNSLTQQEPRIGHVPLYRLSDVNVIKDSKSKSVMDLSTAFAYPAFLEFLERFNKSYTTRRETKRRFRTFQKNMNIVIQLQKNERGSAKYGITKFSDMSPWEFKRTVLTPEWVDNGYPTTYAQIPDVHNVPDAWDWREHGAVSAVKNQGYCGSCWAFSVTGNIEGQWAIKKKKLISLSEQELVDCDKLDSGCNGGLPSNAYREIMRLGGLETEKEYPYDGRGEKCEFKERDVDAYINSSVKISRNETEMKIWLFKNGPISIGINAFPMQFYWGGISHPWKFFCNPSKLDHGVLIVGYGVRGTEPYWIIKNSWGEDWGEKGYYLVYRGDGTCGLNTMCTSAIVS